MVISTSKHFEVVEESKEKEYSGDGYVLVDGDIVAYRSATVGEKRVYSYTNKHGAFVLFSSYKEAKEYCKRHDLDPKKDLTYAYNTEPVENVLHTVKMTMKKIIEASGNKEPKVYLTGSTNFRNDVFEDYKAQRADMRKPTHLDACKTYLIKYYGAIVSDACEADDLISIEAHKLGEDSCVVASLDKDLDMIPGTHYNWVKDKVYEVSEVEGLRIFYRQLLTGDKIDNIPGIKGIGPKTAAKIITEDMTNPYEMYRAVLDIYLNKQIGDDEEVTDPEVLSRVIKEVSRNARLLWLQTSEGEYWQPPVELKENEVIAYHIGVDEATEVEETDAYIEKLKDTMDMLIEVFRNSGKVLPSYAAALTTSKNLRCKITEEQNPRSYTICLTDPETKCILTHKIPKDELHE